MLLIEIQCQVTGFMKTLHATDYACWRLLQLHHSALFISLFMGLKFSTGKETSRTPMGRLALQQHMCTSQPMATDKVCIICMLLH